MSKSVNHHTTAHNDPDSDILLSGPFHLFDGSFILEFLRPARSRHATVMMRTTYKHGHPLCRAGKAHPQAPPLHLHYEQFETFQVVQGTVGTTEGWEAKDQINTPEMGLQVLPPFTPHSFWPDPNATEDAVLLVWAHPDVGVERPMDHVFFYTLLAYLSDVHEAGQWPDLLQVCLLQQASSTAPVLFPRATFLGPLRWWMVAGLQDIAAAVARFTGYKAMMPKYTNAELISELDVSKLKTA